MYCALIQTFPWRLSPGVSDFLTILFRLRKSVVPLIHLRSLLARWCRKARKHGYQRNPVPLSTPPENRTNVKLSSNVETLRLTRYARPQRSCAREGAPVESRNHHASRVRSGVLLIEQF